MSHWYVLHYVTTCTTYTNITTYTICTTWVNYTIMTRDMSDLGRWRKQSSASGSPAELASPMQLGSMSTNLASIISPRTIFGAIFIKNCTNFSAKCYICKK